MMVNAMINSMCVGDTSSNSIADNVNADTQPRPTALQNETHLLECFQNLLSIVLCGKINFSDQGTSTNVDAPGSRTFRQPLQGR